MAGGQERVLRRRIKSVQSTKKITRAHGADRGEPDRQGAGAVQAALPYSESITEVVHDLAAAARPARQPAARAARPRSARSRTS